MSNQQPMSASNQQPTSAAPTLAAPTLAESFTPREIAAAVGASESSVKRWIDDGKLRASRTAGGHRRVSLADAFRFIRATGQTLIDPAALGLNGAEGTDFTDGDSIRDAYCTALDAGDEAAMTRLVTRLHLMHRPLGVLCDDPVMHCYRNLRQRCHHPSAECVVLHRAIANSIRLMHRLRELLDPPAPHAPTALLADVGYEIDGLPTHLAEVVLASLGIGCTQLGVNVPDEVLFGAVARVHPELLWISAAGGKKVDSAAVQRTISEVAAMTESDGTRLVVMSDAMPALNQLPKSLRVGTLAELQSVAAEIIHGITTP